MENPVDKAIELALAAHRGQVDKGGKPYILHPLRVALSLTGLDQQVVAILHDTVEDSDLSLEELRCAGFDETIVTVVDCLTKRTGESYESFINRVTNNPLATTVKIADLQDNMDIFRLDHIGARDMDRLNKYELALARLMSSKNGTPPANASLATTPATNSSTKP